MWNKSEKNKQKWIFKYKVNFSAIILQGDGFNGNQEHFGVKLILYEKNENTPRAMPSGLMAFINKRNRRLN